MNDGDQVRTIIKGVQQCGWVDVGTPHKDVVYGPLGSLQAGGGQARGDGEGLPPAQPGDIGQSAVWEDDVVPPHRHVLQIVHLMKQGPRHSWDTQRGTEGERRKIRKMKKSN